MDEVQRHVKYLANPITMSRYLPQGATGDDAHIPRSAWPRVMKLQEDRISNKSTNRP